MTPESKICSNVPSNADNHQESLKGLTQKVQNSEQGATLKKIASLKTNDVFENRIRNWGMNEDIFDPRY
jgi:hypothetical protein